MTLTMRLVHGAGGEVRHVPTPYVPSLKPAKSAKKRATPDPFRTNGESAAEQLRLLLERVERLYEERDGISDDISDAFAEAKSRGYDPKAMKAILALRRKDKAVVIEEETILELYRQQLGML